MIYFVPYIILYVFWLPLRLALLNSSSVNFLETSSFESSVLVFGLPFVSSVGERHSSVWVSSLHGVSSFYVVFCLVSSRLVLRRDSLIDLGSIVCRLGSSPPSSSSSPAGIDAMKSRSGSLSSTSLRWSLALSVPSLVRLLDFDLNTHTHTAC